MAVSFLKSYSISAMLIGMMVVYAFSRPVCIAYLLRTRVILFSGLFGMALVGIFAQQVAFLACAYAGTLILSDYFVSQCGTPWVIKIYRCILIGSVVPAFIGIAGYDEVVVPLRIVACMALALVSGRIGQGFRVLAVQSPILYIAGTHISYFGSLAAIAWLGGGSQDVKAWYIGSQVGQGILLKMYDYKIRAEVSLTYWRLHIAYVGAAAAGVLLYLCFPHKMALAAYLIGLLGLAVTFRFLKTR
jgi:hypothetical protein